jgi:Na+/melibiose symporter-like transporter
MNEKQLNPNKVPLLDKIIWSSQGFVASLPWVIMGYYLLYFYTDIVKISAALAGTIMFGARMFDAITDLFIGWCIDNFHFKWGKFRTWIRFAIPANIILWPLVFLAFNNVPITVNIVIAIIGYGCFGAIGCTLYYIPTNCQLAILTKDEGERASLVAWKGVAANVATVGAVAVFMPMVNFFGGSNRGFFITALIILIPYVVCPHFLYQNLS